MIVTSASSAIPTTQAISFACLATSAISTMRHMVIAAIVFQAIVRRILNARSELGVTSSELAGCVIRATRHCLSMANAMKLVQASAVHIPSVLQASSAVKASVVTCAPSAT